MGQMQNDRLEAYMPIGDLEGKRDFSFRDIRNFKVMNTTGHKVGTVKDVFVDPNTLEPCFAFLAYEKLLGIFNRNLKHLLVPWSELLIGDDYVQTRWTEDQLTQESQSEQERNLKAHGGPVHRAGGIDTSAEMSPDRDLTPSDEEREPTAASRGLSG